MFSYEAALKMFMSGMGAQDNFVRVSMGKKKSVLTIDAQLSLLDSINYFCFFFSFPFFNFCQNFPTQLKGQGNEGPIRQELFLILLLNFFKLLVSSVSRGLHYKTFTLIMLQYCQIPLGRYCLHLIEIINIRFLAVRFRPK